MPRVFLQFRYLPPACLPAWVVRRDGITLVAINRAATMAQVSAWCPDHLSVEEMNGYREAYGQPPVGLPLSDEFMTDAPFPSDIPAVLRLAVAQTSLFSERQTARDRAALARAHSQLLREQRRSAG